MKKNFLFKALTLMLGMVMCLSVTACDDDDDDDEDSVITTNSVVAVSASYTVLLSQDYYNMWDVVVTYDDAEGTKSETITSAWEKVVTFTNPLALPESLSLKVVANPKASVVVDTTKIYTLSYDYAVVAAGVTLSGSTPVLGADSNSESLPVKGSNSAFQKYITDGRNILDKTVKLSY